MRAEEMRAQSWAVGDREIAHEARRDGAAARLDAPGAVEQQHVAPGAGEIVGRGGAGRTAADHDDIEGHRVRS